MYYDVIYSNQFVNLYWGWLVYGIGFTTLFIRMQKRLLPAISTTTAGTGTLAGMIAKPYKESWLGVWHSISSSFGEHPNAYPTYLQSISWVCFSTTEVAENDPNRWRFLPYCLPTISVDLSCLAGHVLWRSASFSYFSEIQLHTLPSWCR